MTWNPLDWTAGSFLELYILLAIVIFMAGFGLRSNMGSTKATAYELSLPELAFLAGGAARLGDAMLLCLTSNKGATIGPKGKIAVLDQAPLANLMGGMAPLSFRPEMTRQQFQTTVKPLTVRVWNKLQRVGYCPTDAQMMTFRLTVLPFVGLLMIFGGAKAGLGEHRGHPVGILVGLIFLTLFLGFILAQHPKRTRSGERVLERYQASNTRVARAPLEHEYLLAVALSGAIVLSGTAYSSVYAASQTMSSGSSGCGGGGSGCGGGGGCGGCS